jgi:Fungal protein kinase
VAYVWWYDNEGAIQSHGINFVQDLPYFLVLLLCFERFTSRDWGVMPTFRSKEHDTDYCLLSFPPPPTLFAVDVEINHTDKIRGHFGIVGRATQMLHAISHSKDPRDVSTSLGDMELVVKVYWPEASRVREGEIIETARQIAKQNDVVNGHIPDLICSHDFGEYSTKGIRTALGIVSKGQRLLRVMLFRRLYPITDLTGEKFWQAFWECYFCKCTPALCCSALMLLRC